MKKGERNNQFFLNSENNKKKKSSIRKLIQADGKETTNPESISKKILSFYEDLYDEKLDTIIDQETSLFLYMER